MSFIFADTALSARRPSGRAMYVINGIITAIRIAEQLGPAVCSTVA